MDEWTRKTLNGRASGGAILSSLENHEILTPLPPKMHALGGVRTLSLKSLRGHHYEATTQANTGYIANLVSDV